MANNFNGSELLLLNRGGTTYKSDVAGLADYVLTLSQTPNSGYELELNDLKDVTAAVTGSHAQGVFLFTGTTNDYFEADFAAEVTTVIKEYLDDGSGNILIPTSVFQMSDVTNGRGGAEEDANPIATDYNDKFLFGVGGEFVSTDFKTKVDTIIGDYLTANPVAGKLGELTDVADSASTSPQEDEVLIYQGTVGTDGEWKHLDIVNIVNNIITDGSIDGGGGGTPPLIPDTALPTGDYTDASDTDYGGKGIVSVVPVDTTKSVYLTVTGGELDVVSNVPDTFNFIGTFTFVLATGAVTSYDPALPPSPNVGDLYIAKETAGTIGSSVTLNTSDGFNGLVVTHGSMVVYGSDTAWHVIGGLDYDAVTPDLQDVLDEGAAATGGGTAGWSAIALTDASFTTTAGDFATTAGNVQVTTGNVAVGTGNVTVTQGNIVIGNDNAVTDDNSGYLSVAAINWDRFENLPTP